MADIYGHEEVRLALQGRMIAALPTELTKLEDRRGLVAGALDPLIPAAVFVSERPRLEADEWPALIIVADTTPRIETAPAERAHPALNPTHEGPTGGLGYRFTYAMWIELYVRGESFEETSVARDRLVAASRGALLTFPALADNARILPESYRDEMLNVLPRRDARGATGARLLFQVRTEEVLSTQATAVADTVGATATKVRQDQPV